MNDEIGGLYDSHALENNDYIIHLIRVHLRSSVVLFMIY